MGEDRLIKLLVEQGTIGRKKRRRIEEFEHLDPENGLTRVSGSTEDMEARKVVVAQMRDLGMDIRVDKVGNIFGHLGGLVNRGGIMIGSHIDSVIDGGMFDGNVGVFGALEAVRRLRDEDFQNIRPIDVAVYTGEEGSAFNYVLLGSSVLTGKLPIEDAYKLKDHEGKDLKTTLSNIGFRGDFTMDLRNVEYHLELHVEQGPVMENKKYDIGIVQNITGLTWMQCEITGFQGHAGTTPMQMRKDSLVAASEVIQYINMRAKELGSTTVGTVGEIHVEPNLPNVIPRKVLFSIDLRDVNESNRRQLESDILNKVQVIESKTGSKINIATLVAHGATPMNNEVMSIIKNASNELRYRNMPINSGAVHDTQNLASWVKTGMIFIPSKDGVSHAPLEWTDWNLVEKGVATLTKSIRSLSSKPIK